jgi:phenylalanyl-tRNA synthetase alpha chain
MTDEIFAKVKQVIEEIEKSNPTDAESLENYRIQFLGTKNILKPLFGEIAKVDNDRKKEFGQYINLAKQTAEEKFELLKSTIGAAPEKTKSKTPDLTAPGEPAKLGSKHPITIVMNRIIDIFEKIGFTIVEGPEIEDDWHNFTAMNTPEDHPARDMQDTFYLKDSIEMLLRTHTSPVQARVMKSQAPPIRIIAPGRVYRNETISARSHCQFHQLEGLYIDKNVSFVDLKQTLMHFASEMFGTSKIRLRPSYFPFTEPSAEMDVWLGTETEKNYKLTKGTGWLEILGCGMVDPQVLINCGIDPNEYSGFAFGMGIERQAMRLFEVNDIRMFFENDIRFLQQFESVIQ